MCSIMCSRILLGILIIAPSLIASQMNSTVLCMPGQCLQGYSNTTIGAVLSAPNVPTPLHLLPGQYSSSTNPQLLHDSLTSSSASLTPSPGFENSSSSLSLPLNVALQPGLAIYADTLFSGQSAFTNLPSNPIVNSTTPLRSRSIFLSSSVWAAVNSASNDRVILWDSIPDVDQLPSRTLGSLSLADLQSSACSPPCASSGMCTAVGTCQCAPGFTGSSCESCAPGFFGPSCQPCPAGCTSCDEGITGTGRCIKPTIANDPSTCNCLNGACGFDGQCTCNAGFTKADNGTACAKCATGFFLTSTGDCRVCQLGCNECADGTGACTACKNGFSQDVNDRTKCNPPPSVTSTGTICPDGSFGNGSNCTPCSSSCQTCTGASDSDCIICASGKYTLNGACVSADSDGICSGTKLFADNNKHECDTCGAKCTSCKIPSFSLASTIDQLQCTGCLAGFVLSNGKCVESCPQGFFVSPQDNLTCTACDSSCGTCVGSSTFCLSCANNDLASEGKCVKACPSNTFSSSGSCLTCHPDCSSCSGASFNQCSSCPPNRPVLINGRCLPTCSRSQYFDSTTSSCQTCDSSCSSCSGAGSNNCLACSSASQVLRAGTCVAANCQQGTSVISGLGVCLSELVAVPQPSGTTTLPPLPTITGLTTPTNISTRRPLAWWEILLMALGCAFIFLVFIWICRRRARKQRAKRTALFANGAVPPRGQTSWRWRLIRFGEKLFGHNRSRKIVVLPPLNRETESFKLNQLRAAEEARIANVGEEEDMVRLIGSYQYSRPASPQPSRYNLRNHHLGADERSISEASQHSAPSIYSQMTGLPRKIPDPRQPVKKNLMSRFSSSTYSSSEHLSATDNPPKNPFWK